ncbi:VTT domain-containing protein [Citricoccus sp. NPDC055426]|uniref:DedA family protein n=1 Tax=Citricoccus sp. NPDC055426 TaxID=3155536 RepID=UPI00342630AE
MEWMTAGLAALSSAWVYPAAAGLVALSALIPPVPSTSLFVALGALWSQDGLPNGFLLVVAMLAGAVSGDLVTYLLVRRRDVAQWRVLQGPRAQRALNASSARMAGHSAVSWVLTSRFVPLGRLTMNVACAIAPVPLRTFTLFSLAAGILWSLYSVGVGALSGLLPGLSTELAVVLAIAFSLALGRGISAVSTWYLVSERAP